MTDEVRRALGELPDKLRIGGVDYDIPPLTVTKMEMLDRMIVKFDDLQNETGDSRESINKLKEVRTEAVRAFLIMRQPNPGENDPDIKEPTEEEINKLKRTMLVLDIPKIIVACYASLRFEHLLKNAETPPEKPNSPGANSSRGSSTSPDGASTISPVNLASEV
jgi:hypothetical protein